MTSTLLVDRHRQDAILGKVRWMADHDPAKMPRYEGDRESCYPLEAWFVLERRIRQVHSPHFDRDSFLEKDPDLIDAEIPVYPVATAAMVAGTRSVSRLLQFDATDCVPESSNSGYRRPDGSPWQVCHAAPARRSMNPWLSCHYSLSPHSRMRTKAHAACLLAAEMCGGSTPMRRESLSRLLLSSLARYADRRLFELCRLLPGSRQHALYLLLTTPAAEAQAMAADLAIEEGATRTAEVIKQLPPPQSHPACGYWWPARFALALYLDQCDSNPRPYNRPEPVIARLHLRPFATPPVAARAWTAGIPDLCSLVRSLSRGRENAK